MGPFRAGEEPHLCDHPTVLQLCLVGSQARVGAFDHVIQRLEVMQKRDVRLHVCTACSGVLGAKLRAACAA